ncbi:EH signature domain-containing protein, partial [Enterococcus faecalis]|uniref:EH signature domain-containing protein n=1 Tax=Enterococcus faecalis TaxID=1351 RepID=UPI0027BAC7C3
MVIKRLIGWLQPDEGGARRSGAPEAISAMLSPWVNRKPPLNLDRFLVSSLVDMYDDPRVQRGGVWAGVEPEKMAVIMRWLTGENIKFFLDVVSQVEDSHMWEPRREFWLGLHQEGRIDAAWVAFSPAGARVASASAQQGDNRQSLAFGLQVARG